MNSNFRAVAVLVSGLLACGYSSAGPTTIQLGKLPNWNPPATYSLEQLFTDSRYQAEVWAVAGDGNFCHVPYGDQTYTFVTLGSNGQVLGDDAVMKPLLERAIFLHRTKCPGTKFSRAVAILGNISVVDMTLFHQALRDATGYGVFAAMQAKVSMGPGGTQYENKVSAVQKRQAYLSAEAQQKADAQRASDSRTQTLADRYGASSGWINWQQLRTNPFSYEGKTFLFNGEFQRMLSPTSGIFSGAVFNDVPKTAFTHPVRVVVAGKVLGATTMKNEFGGEVSVPNVKYLGHVTCSDGDCGGLFKGKLRSN